MLFDDDSFGLQWYIVSENNLVYFFFGRNMFYNFDIKG